MQILYNGRLGNSLIVHKFVEHGGNNPMCGSGNTHNINMRIYRRIKRTNDLVTCKKCLKQIESES